MILTALGLQFVLLGILFGLGTVSVMTQVPPPPARGGAGVPPAALNTPFESKEGGFKIAFPARPTEESRDSETSFGKTKMSSYMLPTSLAFYSVVYVDFPTAIKEKFDLDTRYDAMRDLQVKRTNGRVTLENELYFGTHYGRDLVVEDANFTNWVRAIMVEQRLFVITVQTRGSQSKHSPILKTANESRVKKFFDSFAVTEIPKPKLTAVQLPADFGISVAGSTFSSTFFEISFQVPKDWVVLQSSESEQLFELGKAELTKTNPRLAQYLDSQNSRILLTVSKSALESTVNRALLIVAAEKAPYPNFLPMSAAKTYIASFLDRTEKVVKEPVMQEISGIEFAWLETYDSSTKRFQRMYFANRKGIALEFSLTYADPGELQVMLRSIESLKTK